MKKRILENKTLHILLFIALILLLCTMFSIKTSAAETNGSEYSLVDQRVEAILFDFAEVLPENMQSFSEPYASSDAVGVVFLIESAVAVVNGHKGELLKFLLMLFGASMIMSLVSLQEGEMGRVSKNAVFLITSALIVDKVFDTVVGIGESLGEINAFFSAAIPVITAVNTLGASPGLATAQTLGMSITLQIYSFFGGGFLYSLSGIMLIFSALSALDGTTFGKMSATLRKTFITVMGILTAFVGATFSLQSIISGTADSSALRGAKYAVSGMIPIVGGSISSALNTLLGGVAYLRGVIGGGAVAVIISLALGPLVVLLAYRMCFNIVAFFVAFCADNSAENTLNSFASVFDTLIASYSLTVVIYVLEIVVFLKGGAGIA